MGDVNVDLIHNLWNNHVTRVNSKLKSVPDKLSICTTVKNHEKFASQIILHLHETLSSRAVPHQIIVVDNYSQDNSYSCLQELAKRRHIEQLLVIKNQGEDCLWQAQNLALDYCDGTLLIFFPLDGAILPDQLLKIYLNSQKVCNKDKILFSGHFDFFSSKIINYSKYKFFSYRFLCPIGKIFMSDNNKKIYQGNCGNLNLYSKELVEKVRPLVAFKKDRSNSSLEREILSQIKKYLAQSSRSLSTKVSIDWVYSWIYKKLSEIECQR